MSNNVEKNNNVDYNEILFVEKDWKEKCFDLKEENLILKEKNILLKEKMLLSSGNYHKFIVRIFNSLKWFEFLNEMVISKIKFIKSFDNHFVKENLVVISILNKDFNKFFKLLENVIDKKYFYIY